MALRNIVKYGDELLRKKSKYVSELKERDKILIEDMLETMYQAQGVGLAAPQVGILKRIVVIDVGAGSLVLVNPEIIETEGSIIDEEGCLSIPGTQGNVARPEKVTAKALDKNGQEIIVKGEGLLARAICHELDHLDGILFVDKMTEGEN